MKRILFLVGALACCSTAFGQLYKSIDKDGRVIYSDQPPATTDSKQLKISPGTSPAPPASSKARDKELEKTRATAREKSKADEEKTKQAKANEERCSYARMHLQTLTSGGRFAMTDAKGERYYLDENQLEAEQAKARKSVDEACKAS